MPLIKLDTLKIGHVEPVFYMQYVMPKIYFVSDIDLKARQIPFPMAV